MYVNFFDLNNMNETKCGVPKCYSSAPLYSHTESGQEYGVEIHLHGITASND